jgi:hypothetical protein
VSPLDRLAKSSLSDPFSRGELGSELSSIQETFRRGCRAGRRGRLVTLLVWSVLSLLCRDGTVGESLTRLCGRVLPFGKNVKGSSASYVTLQARCPLCNCNHKVHRPLQQSPAPVHSQQLLSLAHSALFILQVVSVSCTSFPFFFFFFLKYSPQLWEAWSCHLWAFDSSLGHSAKENGWGSPTVAKPAFLSSTSTVGRSPLFHLSLPGFLVLLTLSPLVSLLFIASLYYSLSFSNFNVSFKMYYFPSAVWYPGLASGTKKNFQICSLGTSLYQSNPLVLLCTIFSIFLKT